MIEYNEIVTLVLGTGCLLFIFIKRPQLRRIPFAPLLFSSYYYLYTGWVLTVLEGVLWQNFLNIAEHLSYTLSTAFLACWCWNIAFRNTGSS